MTDETNNEESTPRHLSRRTALKGIGIGAATAWTAPMILSTNPAFAGAVAGSSPCSAPCDSCFDAAVGSECGSAADGVPCYCSENAEGTCVCSADTFDANFTTCNGTGDCPPNENCLPINFSGCVGGQKYCIPTCASEGQQARAKARRINGRRPSGRS